MPAQHERDTMQGAFMLANIMAMLSSSFTHSFGDDQHQAVIRVLLRHGTHKDGSHYNTKLPGGLHPTYIAFNPTKDPVVRVISRSEHVEASLGNVFDAITTHDHLDGGISLPVRCPGSVLPPNSTGRLTVDAYITPRELIRNEHVNGDMAMVIQAFIQEFALPHLQRFVEQCKIESVKAPKPCSIVKPISLKGPNHLPSFQNAFIACIQCSSLDPDEKLEPSDDMRHSSPSATIRESVTLTPDGTTKKRNSVNVTVMPVTPTTIRQRSACKHRPADAFQFTTKGVFGGTDSACYFAQLASPGYCLN